MQKIFSFSDLSGEVQDGRSKVQILKTGTFKHAQYGEFTITNKDLKEFKVNFDENKRGVDLAVDENHEGSHKAVGWFKEVIHEGDKLFAIIEWTKEGLELLKNKVYRYFSPELYFEFQDEESGETLKNLLIGGGITNRPFFKNMEALAACETTQNTTHYFLNIEQMKHFKEVNDNYKNKAKLSFSEMEEIRLSFSELSEADQNVFGDALNQLEKKFNSQDEADKQPQEESKGNEEEPSAEPATQDPEPTVTPNEEPKGEGEENKGSEAFSGIDFNSKEFSELMKKATGLGLEEVKALQKNFSEISALRKKENIEKQINGLIFNETTKTGFILPKGKDLVTNFVSKLNDNLTKEFFEVLPQIVKSVNFAEIGKEGKNAIFSVSETTPFGVTRESFVLDQVAKKYCEQNPEVNYEEAIIKAQEIIAKQGIK